MQALLETLRVVQLVVFVGLGVAAAFLYRRHRDPAPGWLAVTFGLLAVVVVAGRLLPDETDTTLTLLAAKTTIALLALFPYALYRFMRALLPPWRFLPRIAGAMAFIIVAWVFALPELPSAGEPRSALFDAFVVALLAYWTVLSGIVAGRLWLAGRTESLVARKRLRLLALGSVAMNIALLLAGFQGDAPLEGIELATSLFAIGSAPLFYAGFAPPRILRATWRRPVENALLDAELGLVAATTPRAVADAIIPFVHEVFGGRGGLLADARGDLVVAHGLTRSEPQEIIDSLRSGPPFGDSVTAVPLQQGWLAVITTPVTPLFGEDEIDLLKVLGAFVDIALDRAELFEKEREAREEIERASEELEGLVYGLSHDLKSPIVTVLGYLDLLELEYGAVLGDEGRDFLRRMKQSGQYMRELLNDLLELSRIGRTDIEVEDVDLEGTAAGLVDSVAASQPGATIEIGPLPTVRMNPVRAKQLLTNLVDNAVLHGGRNDITISLRSGTHDGDVRVVVRDNGRGVPVEARERIFELFEQGDRRGRGTGVGLTMCRKIMEAVGGTIRLRDGPGQGATFELVFPRAAVVGEDGGVTVVSSSGASSG